MCEGDGAERDGCRVPALVTGCALVDSVKQHERYGQLTLVNSTAADTGEFSCWGQLCTQKRKLAQRARLCEISPAALTSLVPPCGEARGQNC